VQPDPFETTTRLGVVRLEDCIECVIAFVSAVSALLRKSDEATAKVFTTTLTTTLAPLHKKNTPVFPVSARTISARKSQSERLKIPSIINQQAITV